MAIIRQRTTPRSFRTQPPGKGRPGLFRISVDRHRRIKSRARSVGKEFEEAMSKAMRNSFAGTAQKVAYFFMISTPIDTGYARSRWQITRSKIRKKYLISNDAPYIGRLEDGYSKQAKEGITKKATQKLRAEGIIK